MDPVTDPELLAQLEADPPPPRRVTDPNLLALLEAPEFEAEAPPFLARVGRGFMDIGQGAKLIALQLADKLEGTDRADSYRERVNEDLKYYNRGHAASGGGVDWGRMLGGAAATAPLGGAAALPASLGGRVALGGALGAATGGVQYSEDGEHLGNVLIGGVTGGAVPAVGNVLRRTLTGLRPSTQEAAQMLQQGVPLTPGQVAGGAARTVEDVLARAPFSGPAVRASQTNAMGEWNRSLMDSIRPGAQRISAPGPQGMRELTQQFDNAYNALLDQPLTLRNGQQVASGRSINDAQRRMRDAAFDALRNKDSEQAAYFFAERDKLLNQLPDDVLAGLRQLDGMYPEFAALRQATGYMASQRQGGVFAPAQLQMASRAVDRSAGKGATARGTAPMQPQAQAGMHVFGTGSGPPAGVLERAALAPVGLATRPFYTQPAQRLARGGYDWQRSVDHALETSALLRALRKQTAPLAAVSATEPEGYQ